MAGVGGRPTSALEYFRHQPSAADAVGYGAGPENGPGMMRTAFTRQRRLLEKLFAPYGYRPAGAPALALAELTCRPIPVSTKLSYIPFTTARSGHLLVRCTISNDASFAHCRSVKSEL